MPPLIDSSKTYFEYKEEQAKQQVFELEAEIVVGTPIIIADLEVD